MLLHDADDGTRTKDRRRYRRASLLHSGSLHSGVAAVDCVIRDISAVGARLRVERRLDAADGIVIDIDGMGLFPGRLVWQREDEAGIQFLADPELVRSSMEAAFGRGLIQA